MLDNRFLIPGDTHRHTQTHTVEREISLPIVECRLTKEPTK
ncbi:MAG TPA: hypothetical protein VKA87_04205 [Nitrososphaeraceae archaeon]|nr:hypothetical protein [Nitrososphaeraceae archaeon]